MKALSAYFEELTVHSQTPWFKNTRSLGWSQQRGGTSQIHERMYHHNRLHCPTLGKYLWWLSMEKKKETCVLGEQYFSVWLYFEQNSISKGTLLLRTLTMVKLERKRKWKQILVCILFQTYAMDYTWLLYKMIKIIHNFEFSFALTIPTTLHISYDTLIH